MIGGSSLGIGMTMFLRDQFSAPAARISAASKDLQRQMRMQQDQLRHQRNLSMGIAFGGVMALRGIGRQIKKAADYRYEMEFVKSITAATNVEQKKLMNTAERLAGQTMFYPQDIAEGMRFMAMAGMKVEQVLQNITGAVNLAGSTMSTLGGKGGAADIMTNVMKQFGIDFKYTIDVADRLAYGVTRANTNLFDLGEALKYSGATAMDLNISLDESIAMIMALGNAGMQGSMAGVAMENSMRYMARAFSSFGSGPSQRALAELGMTMADVTDQSGNLLTMTQVMVKFGQAIERNFGTGMNLEKQAILQAVFGVRGKRKASLLLRNLQEFQEFSGDIATKSAGHSGKIMKDMMSTLKGEMDKLKSEWQAMWIAFTAAIEPAVKFFVKLLKGITKGFSLLFKLPFLGEFLASGVAGFILIGTVAAAYKAIVAGLKLIYVQAQATMGIMSQVSVAGWTKMTGAALRYSAAVNAGQAIAMVRAGQLAGVTLNKSGRAISSQTGRFISAANMGLLASGTGRMVAGKVVGRSVTGFALKGIAGALGGPLGMALMFVLPGLIGMAIRAIKGNKEATEANSKALQDKGLGGMGEYQKYSRMEHAIKFFGATAPITKLIGTTGMGVPDNLTGKSKDLAAVIKEIIMMEKSQPLILNISLDGETIFSEQIEKQLQKQSDYQERNIGVY